MKLITDRKAGRNSRSKLKGTRQTVAVTNLLPNMYGLHNDILYAIPLKHYLRMLSFLYKNNMAEQVEKSDDKIKVTVKTPRDKKEVHVEGNGTIKQVMFDHIQSVQHNVIIYSILTKSAGIGEPES